MTEVELGRMDLGRNQYVVSLELGIFQGRPKSIRPNSETVKIRPMAREADSTHFRSPCAHNFGSTTRQHPGSPVVIMMSTQNSKQGTNSRSAVAKYSCKKVVKDDDPSGIGCHGCVKWFHGQYVSLSDDEVKWLNCLWMCDACLESNSPILPEAKSLSLQNDNITTHLKSVSGRIDSLREVVSNQNSKNLADSPANKSQLKDVVEKSRLQVTCYNGSLAII